jgi:prepilin-type processing-associated H-X9-DG protein
MGSFDWNYAYYSYDLNATPPIRNLEVVRSRIATLTCASDEPQVNTTIAADGAPIAYHNYVANYGNTDHVSLDYLGPASPAYIKFLGSPFAGDDWDPKSNRFTKFRQITDGLSKTLLMSETVQGHNGDLRGLTWWGWSAGFEAFATPNASEPDLLQSTSFCKKQVPNPPCDGQSGPFRFKAMARSRHPGGVNAVMCDGSVRFVTDSIDLATWRAASTTQGDEVYDGLAP